MKGEKVRFTPILVISADWRTRALLAAQVGETTGADTLSAPGVDEAIALIEATGACPLLLIVDAGAKMPAENVEDLLRRLPGVPLVLCVSALHRAAFDPLRSRCAAYLTRPASIGQIAQAAARALQDAKAQREDAQTL